MTRPARTARSNNSSVALLCAAIIFVNLCAVNALPVERETVEEASNVELLQHVTCLIKGFTPLECANGKRTRKVDELAEGNESTLLNPLALVHARRAETPRSHPGTAAKSPPAKKHDGFYSDW